MSSSASLDSRWMSGRFVGRAGGAQTLYRRDDLVGRDTRFLFGGEATEADAQRIVHEVRWEPQARPHMTRHHDRPRAARARTTERRHGKARDMTLKPRGGCGT